MPQVERLNLKMIRAPDSKLRRRLETFLRWYKAILLLTCNFTKKKSSEIDRIYQHIDILPRAGIRELLAMLENTVKQLKRDYGVKADLTEMEELIRRGCELLDSERTLKDPYFEQSADKYINVRKDQLEAIFDHYERRIDVFPMLPPHALIGIDMMGFADGQIEIFLLEASLFEDMASLLNATVEVWNFLNKCQEKSKPLFKRMNALSRSTVKAAYGLIEGYLKCLALDILLTQQVSPEEKTKLTEWDEAKSRPALMKLRDKLLQYPKIALQLQHPPLTEHNCSEIAEILEAEKLVRHTVVHPSPILKLEYPESLREELFYRVSPAVARDICDLVISLIFKISNTVGEKFGKVSYWLVPRDQETGCFPDSVFF
jgi:hypothetical protein